MSNDPLGTYDEKVRSIFQDLAGDRAKELHGDRLPKRAREIAEKALLEEYGQKKASDIALHMTDWNGDAAFIVALCLFPERFTKEEIDAGIGMFLTHAPNHIREACGLTDTYVWENWPYNEKH
jgi:hypothetical protein